MTFKWGKLFTTPVEIGVAVIQVGKVHVNNTAPGPAPAKQNERPPAGNQKHTRTHTLILARLSPLFLTGKRRGEEGILIQKPSHVAHVDMEMQKASA